MASGLDHVAIDALLDTPCRCPATPSNSDAIAELMRERDVGGADLRDAGNGDGMKIGRRAEGKARQEAARAVSPPPTSNVGSASA